MMEDRPPLTLGDALMQRWLLVLAIVATFVLGGAILSMQAPAYAASAMIYLDVSRTAPGFDEGAAAGAAPDVACTDEERSAPETRASRITASADRGTSTLRVTAAAPTAIHSAA